MENIQVGKRKPIKNRIRKLLLLVSIFAILIISIIGIIFMRRIRENTEKSLINQMKQNIITIVSDKVSIAILELEKYQSYMQRDVKLIDLIWNHPEDYVKNPVAPPNIGISNVYTMQKYYANKEVDKAAVEEEVCLLGNIKSAWVPMMARDGNVISTVYLATETGIMLSYDKNSNLAELDEDGESYFDYFDRYWYTKAKEKNEVVFTDLVQDDYGRGLTLTCAAPFYYGREFAGVIAMDILVTDLQKEIVDVDFGVGSDAFAFIINKAGDIVASPYVELTQTEFDNIYDEKNVYYPIRHYIKSGNTDIEKTGDIYCAFASIGITDWTFCIQMPESLILQPTRAIDKQIRYVIFLFIASFCVIALLVAVASDKFSQKIIQPILNLKNDVEVMSNGDLDKQAIVHDNDEIGDLAHAFNNMTASLKKYIKDLTDVTAEKERIGAELNVATQIQASMLPTDFENYVSDKRFSIFASMTPAKEVGGDFYDFFMIDDTHMAIVVADVSGKGVPAALFMVIGKTLIKDHSMSNRDLGEIFAEVNDLLCEANSEELFITAFEAVIDLETGKVRYVNAGHEMPYIYRKGKDWNAFEMKAAFVLAGMEGVKYKAGEFDIEPGDKIFQYTDGVTEATNANNELYGMDRLKKILDANVDMKPSELLPVVKADIDKFVGEAPQFDDITMLGFEYLSNTKE